MPGTKTDIIAQLQRDILPLQRFKKKRGDNIAEPLPASITNAFPNAEFPFSAIHEFIAAGAEDVAASGGFISGILASLMDSGGATIWISPYRTLFPPALAAFGVAPDKIIFIDLEKEKEILWAMEEALKCKGLAAVVGEITELSFTASRRLQLAVEESKVTGFIIRQNPRAINITACVARWKITSLPSEAADDLPGVGFPRWNAELLKIRNGKPGKWEIEFTAGHFRHISKMTVLPQEQQKKTG
jgi:protein ImuA